MSKRMSCLPLTLGDLLWFSTCFDVDGDCCVGGLFECVATFRGKSRPIWTGVEVVRVSESDVIAMRQSLVAPGSLIRVAFTSNVNMSFNLGTLTFCCRYLMASQKDMKE